VKNSVYKTLLSCSLFLVMFLALGFDNGQNEIKFTRPSGWPKPVYNLKKNKITEAGFRLGRKLFYDPILSRDGTIACSNCHTQWSAFTHVDHGLSHGVNGLIGKRNSPALVNLAWNTTFMWDGSVHDLESQPIFPITSRVEMGNTLEDVVKRLDTSRAYRTRFFLAFGDSAATAPLVLKALAQFTVMLQSYNSKYDKYIRHEPGGTFSEQELHGYMIFREKCESCHKEPLFTDYSFKNVGLSLDPGLRDSGRMAITHDPADYLKFKVPSLRNVAMTYPYMHDGRFNTIRQVLDHYTSSIVQSPTLAEEFKKPMVLDDQDKKDLISFLQTLTDKDFLLDPRFKNEGY